MKFLFIPFTLLLYSQMILAEMQINQKLAESIEVFDGLSQKKIKLDSLKGKNLIFEWFNDGCPFVKKHYDSKNMQMLQKKAKKLDFIWISVSSSALGKQGHLSSKTDIDLINKNWKIAPDYFIFDHEGSLGKIFGAKVTPHLFILNKDQQLVYKGAIDSIKSAEAKDVNAPNVEKYFEKALDAIFSNKLPEPAITSEYGCSVKYK